MSRCAASTAVLITGLLGLTGCTADPDPAARPEAAGAASSAAASGTASGTASTAVPQHSHAPSAQASGAARAATDEEGAAAGIRLQALLGQHSVLAADMMRARLRDDPDFGQATDAALRRNTQAMTSLVDSLFGAQAGSAFSSRWAVHIRSLLDYTQALADKDTSGRERIRAALVTQEQDLAAFFASASGGRLDPGAARSAVRMHVDHLLDQAGAYAAGRYDRSARDYQRAYTHAFEMGGVLAGALLPVPVASSLQQPSWRLRSALTRLLGEHVALVVAATRAAPGEAADFDSLAASLNRNTVQLAQAVESLFGAGPASRFQELWADHVDALVAYTSSATGGDAAAAGRARARLRGFERELASFLSTATRSRLSAGALTEAFLHHDGMLVEQVDAYRQRDYQRSHDLGYQAYEEMFELAGQLARAIDATLAERRPEGGTDTGGGGLATAGSP